MGMRRGYNNKENTFRYTIIHGHVGKRNVPGRSVRCWWRAEQINNDDDDTKQNEIKKWLESRKILVKMCSH